MTQKEYEKQVEEARQEVTAVLKKYNLAIKPILHITETGVIPVMTFINTTAEDVQDVKLIMPEDFLKK